MLPVAVGKDAGRFKGDIWLPDQLELVANHEAPPFWLMRANVFARHKADRRGPKQRANVHHHPKPTVFHNDWWLDIVSDGKWQASKIFENGRLVAWMPYFPKPRLWWTESRMPVATHFLGPALLGQDDHVVKFERKQDLLRRLISGIPDLACFTQKMHRGIDNVISFQSAGYETGAQFTFEISPDHPDALWKRMRDKTRNVIRSAAKHLTVDRDIETFQFIDFYSQNLLRKGQGPLRESGRIETLLETCRRKDAGYVLTARDSRGDAKAAIFCAWDATAFYFIFSTRTADSGNGAVSLLLWEAIQDAARRGCIFDFDGLGHAGSVLFYSGFGATPQPRYTVYKSSTSFRLVREGRRLFKAPDNYFTSCN